MSVSSVQRAIALAVETGEVISNASAKEIVKAARDEKVITHDEYQLLCDLKDRGKLTKAAGRTLDRAIAEHRSLLGNCDKLSADQTAAVAGVGGVGIKGEGRLTGGELRIRHSKVFLVTANPNTAQEVSFHLDLPVRVARQNLELLGFVKYQVSGFIEKTNPYGGKVTSPYLNPDWEHPYASLSKEQIATVAGVGGVGLKGIGDLPGQIRIRDSKVYLATTDAQTGEQVQFKLDSPVEWVEKHLRPLGDNKTWIAHGLIEKTGPKEGTVAVHYFDVE